MTSAVASVATGVPQITFDEMGHLRLLEADHTHDGLTLAHDSLAFVNKINAFRTHVERLQTVLSDHAQRLEREQLKAIGERTAIETESESRRRRCVELQHAIAAAAVETNRTQDYLESLQRIETENRLILEKLEAN